MDNVHGTIRLPKYPTTHIYGLTLSAGGNKSATVSIRGNGKALSITNGSSTGAWVGVYNARGDNGTIYMNTGSVGVVLPSGIGGSYFGGAIGISTNASNSGLTGSVTLNIPGSGSYASLPCTYFIYVT